MAILKGFPPSNTISPSVRIAEKDLSFYESERSYHKAGMVGFASKGPIGVPTLVRNQRELNDIFGYPHPDVGDPYLIYAAQQYMRIASDCYIVRVGVSEPVEDEAAAIAEVDVPSAGGVVLFASDTPDNAIVDGDGIVIAGGYSFDSDSFFRWRLNGNIASKTLVVLANANRPSPLTNTAYTCEQLVEDLNLQLTYADDGIQFYCTDDDEIGIMSVFSYGPDSSIELVSVSDSIYGGTVVAGGGTNVTGLGTGMTRAVAPGSNLGWPTSGSAAVDGTWDFSELSDMNLQVVVDGTDNVLIDNVVQVIDLAAIEGTSASTAEVVAAINTQIASLPGGFQAVGGGVGPTDADYAAEVAALSVTLISNHFGQDAKILVKADSTADTVFGFENLTYTGASPERDTGDADVYVAGIVNGSENTTGATTMTITADSPGIDGNDTQVVITNDTHQGTFTMDIYNNSVQMETWGNLTKDETSSYYVEVFLNVVSDWVKVEDVTSNPASPADGTYSLTGGEDGIPADPDDQDTLLIGNNTSMSGVYALSEPEQIDIDLLAVPGHSSTSVITAMIDVCQNYRMDSMCIVDPPFGLTVSEIIQWQNGVHPLNTTKLDTDFAALYWPWVKIRDSWNGIDVWAPPSGSVMAVYARNDLLAYPWWAPAGAERGQVPAITDVFSRPTLVERDLMYGYRNAINPIVQFADIDGFVVWGQKTLQRRPTALDRVNVRRMLFVAAKMIRKKARRLLFNPHDEIFRERFINIATGVLEEIKVGRGLTDYKIKADEELNTPEVIDRNEFRARIGVKPTKAVEFIFIEFSIHNQADSFEETSENF